MRRASADALPPGFDEFVVAQTQPLLRLALALTGNGHDAWDLLQETFVRTGERWGRARVDEPVAYARTVMVRLNIDVGTWLPAALATLSPRQRTALALRYVEDLDVRSIAERMGCSEGTVKSQLSRGTARLKARAPPLVTGTATGGDDLGRRRTP